MDLDSLEDDTPFIVEDDEDEESQNLKLEKENANAKAKVAFLSAQPSYPNVEQLTTLLVKSLKPELTKLLTYHDFSASLSKELKELPSKFSDISGEIKDLKRYVEGLEIEILSELKTIPKKLEEFQSTISGQVSSIPAQLSKLKTLDALPSLLNKVTEALNRFAQAVESVSQKASDPSVPSIGQAGPHKGKNVMSPKDAEEKETESDSKTEVRLSGSMVESSKKKHLKKFDFITEQGENIHLTEEQIKEQKRIEESVKADLAKKEVELGREELVDLLGINVVTSTYKSKLKYDKYCDKMLNRRALGKITNYDANDLHLSEWREVMNVCPKRTGARWTTIYSQIQTRMENLYKIEAELELDFSKPLGKQDPIMKLNDLAKKKSKHDNCNTPKLG
ncbi:hypothetical protein Tco_0039401 [Tanacetum coccineum]